MKACPTRLPAVAAFIFGFSWTLPDAPAAASESPAPPHVVSATRGGSTSNYWGVVTPSWLTESSLTTKEGYDTNVFGTIAVPLPGTPDLANVSSWFTTVSVRLTANLLSSARPARAFLTTLNLGYAADYTVYNVASSEDNLRNNFTQQLKGKSGAWSVSFDNSLIYVVGRKYDPIYATYSPLGYAATRERRHQIQERNTSFVRYDQKTWFARVVASALYYNLLIDEQNPVGPYRGYVNWVNREDVNTGVDFGCKLTPDFSVTAGWRLGEQTQARLYFSPTHNDNTYNRALIGFEGKLRPWLQLQFVAGPDFRRYSDNAHLGLAGDRHTWLYTESALTASFSPQNSFVLANRVWHFAASGGSNSYQETATSINYKHAFTKAWSGAVGVKVQGARYDTPSVRNDWATTYLVNLACVFNRGMAASIDYNRTRGRSEISPAIAPGRDWDEETVSLTLKVSI
jgi:hypothetical protein